MKATSSQNGSSAIFVLHLRTCSEASVIGRLGSPSSNQVLEVQGLNYFLQLILQRRIRATVQNFSSLNLRLKSESNYVILTLISELRRKWLRGPDPRP